jgi:carboxypeptidase C (cathepsin A)
LQGSSDVIGDDQVHRKLYLENDRPIDVTPYVGDLLDADIPVLVYNGDRDMTTNVVGSELLLNGIDWKGKDEWLDADRGVWMVENVKGGEGGWAKEYMALKFVVIYNSGHSTCTSLRNHVKLSLEGGRTNKPNLFLFFFQQ